MIPFLLIAGGAYLLGSAMHVKKLSMGDYLDDKPIEPGDEVVFHFNDDSWLEIYENEEFPSSEISFPAGESFEVVVFDMDAAHYHVKFEDGSVAFIPKDEVTIVAVNDEVAVAFKKGGIAPTLAWFRGLSKKPRQNKYWAKEIVQKDGKYYLLFVDVNKDDKVVKRKAFDKLEDAQVYKINYNNPDERVGTIVRFEEVVNVDGEKAYISPSDSYYTGAKFEGSFENYDEWPIVFGDTKEEVIEELKEQLIRPPKSEYNYD